jgi:hypothetical protein
MRPDMNSPVNPSLPHSIAVGVNVIPAALMVVNEFEVIARA